MTAAIYARKSNDQGAVSGEARSLTRHVEHPDVEVAGAGNTSAGRQGRLWAGLGATALLVLIAFWAGIEWARTWFDLDSPEKFGAIASAIGAVFSALAFVGIVGTILFQSMELALQRDELSATREVLRAQQEQLAEQSRVMAIDLFLNAASSACSNCRGATSTPFRCGTVKGC